MWKNGQLVGLITYRDILQLHSHPNAVKDEFGRLRVGAALGITRDMLDRTAALQQIGVDVVCLDSAHGHTQGVIDSLKLLRKNFKKLRIIAGNVATASGAKALAEAGADCVKVGIGPGSICTTRIVAGAGVPQITAILEASSSLKKMNDMFAAQLEFNTQFYTPGGLGMLGGFAGGGLVNVPGASKTKDSILALISNKEFVMNPKAVETYGSGLLSAINQQLIPPEALTKAAMGLSKASSMMSGMALPAIQKFLS